MDTFLYITPLIRKKKIKKEENQEREGRDVVN